MSYTAPFETGPPPIECCYYSEWNGAFPGFVPIKIKLSMSFFVPRRVIRQLPHDRGSPLLRLRFQVPAAVRDRRGHIHHRGPEEAPHHRLGIRAARLHIPAGTS